MIIWDLPFLERLLLLKLLFHSELWKCLWFQRLAFILYLLKLSLLIHLWRICIQNSHNLMSISKARQEKYELPLFLNVHFSQDINTMLSDRVHDMTLMPSTAHVLYRERCTQLLYLYWLKVVSIIFICLILVIILAVLRATLAPLLGLALAHERSFLVIHLINYVCIWVILLAWLLWVRLLIWILVQNLFLQYLSHLLLYLLSIGFLMFSVVTVFVGAQGLLLAMLFVMVLGWRALLLILLHWL